MPRKISDLMYVSALIVAGCVAVVIEVLTLYTAYQSSILALMISAALPGLSTVYWIWWQWQTTGIFFGWLAILSLAWLICLAACFAAAKLFDSPEIENTPTSVEGTQRRHQAPDVANKIRQQQAIFTTSLMACLAGLAVYGALNPSYNQAAIDLQVHPIATIIGSLLPVIICTPFAYLLFGWVLRRKAARFKVCEHCAETIKSDAKVCRYCGRDAAPARQVGVEARQRADDNQSPPKIQLEYMHGGPAADASVDLIDAVATRAQSLKSRKPPWRSLAITGLFGLVLSAVGVWYAAPPGTPPKQAESNQPTNPSAVVQAAPRPQPQPSPKPQSPQLAAAGQPQQIPLVYSAWIKLCGKNPQDPNAKELCQTMKEAHMESGQFVAAAALIEMAGEQKKILQLIVPTRLLLPPGVRVTIDANPPHDGPFIICAPEFCMAQHEVTQDFINKLKAGQTVQIQAINDQKQTVSFLLPLADFAKAHDGPPTDPKLLTEQRRQAQKKMQDLLKR